VVEVVAVVAGNFQLVAPTKEIRVQPVLHRAAPGREKAVVTEQVAVVAVADN
jgi:hypothetical protein